MINQDKRHSKEKSSVSFHLGLIVLYYSDQCKYLGLMLDVEHMNFKEGVGVLAQSAGSALGSVLNRVKVCESLGFNTYTQLYNPSPIHFICIAHSNKVR